MDALFYAVALSISRPRPGKLQSLSRVTLCAKKAGEVAGFCYAFETQPAPGVILSTFPDKPETHWEQGFQSFPESILVRKGGG